MVNFSSSFRLLFLLLCLITSMMRCDDLDSDQTEFGFVPDDKYQPPDHQDDRYLFLKDIKEAATRRILGGNVVPAKSYPFVVALLKADKVIHCSGSIIAPTFVVTAAHCDEMTLIYKAIEDNASKVGTIYKIKAVVRHPKYGYETRSTPQGPTVSKITNDIALVESFDNMIKGWVKPISLGKVGLEAVKTKLASAIGYGKIGNKQSGSLESLQFGHVEIDQCFEPGWQISICGNTPSHAKTPTAICSGDSGGPLVYLGNLLGVGSLGPSSCSSNQYLKDVVSVFTLVDPYRPWINEEMRKRLKIAHAGKDKKKFDEKSTLQSDDYVPDANVEKTIHQEVYYVGSAPSIRDRMGGQITNIIMAIWITKCF